MATGAGFKFHRALHRALLAERKNGMDNIETLRAEIDRMTENQNAFLDRLRTMQITALEAEAAPKPWPQVGDECWTLFGAGEVIELTWNNDGNDLGRLSIGNVFRTEQEAKDERDRRKVSAIMREMADDGEYCIRFTGESLYVTTATVYEFSAYRFSTHQTAQACIARIVTELSENGTCDGMARLLKLWVAK